MQAKSYRWVPSNFVFVADTRPLVQQQPQIEAIIPFQHAFIFDAGGFQRARACSRPQALLTSMLTSLQQMLGLQPRSMLLELNLFSNTHLHLTTDCFPRASWWPQALQQMLSLQPRSLPAQTDHFSDTRLHLMRVVSRVQCCVCGHKRCNKC